MTTHKISWLNMPGYKPETWNPIIGCSKVSPGCDNCYAEKMALRLIHMPFTDYYSYVLKDNRKGDPDQFKYIPQWNGETHLVKSALTKPLTWKDPRMVFVCSMGDLFHETVPFQWIDSVFSVMSDNDQHIYVLLTKRPENILKFWQWKREQLGFDWRPKDNVWIGVTAENQEQYNKRVFYLLKAPSAKRFVSIEPMLGPIDLYQMPGLFVNHKLDWVICGGETGHKARPMHPDWVRSVRDQCASANVPFFFKQWGTWQPAQTTLGIQMLPWGDFEPDTKFGYNRKSKLLANDTLDGKQHHEWPKINL